MFDYPILWAPSNQGRKLHAIDETKRPLHLPSPMCEKRVLFDLDLSIRLLFSEMGTEVARAAVSKINPARRGFFSRLDPFNPFCGRCVDSIEGMLTRARADWRGHNQGWSCEWYRVFRCPWCGEEHGLEWADAGICHLCAKNAWISIEAERAGFRTCISCGDNGARLRGGWPRKTGNQTTPYIGYYCPPCWERAERQAEEISCALEEIALFRAELREARREIKWRSKQLESSVRL